MSDNKNFVPLDDDEYERQIYEAEKAKKQNAEEYQKKQRMLEKQREEQRRKQLEQDRIELAKLRAGVIDESESIKEEEKVERVLTTKEKISNFFYHYKVPVIICTIAVIVFGYLIYDTVTRVKPDLTIVSTCNNGLEFRTDELCEYIEQFCPDLNGDGEVKVQIINCPDSDNYQMQDSYNTKILAQLQMDETVIFLTSDGNYNLKGELDSNGNYELGVYMFADVFADLRTIYPDNDSVDEKGYHLDGEKIAEAMGWKDMPDNIIWSMRAPVKPLYGDKEELEKNFEICQEILEKIMKENGDL